MEKLNVEYLVEGEAPDLHEWEPTDNQIFYVYEEGANDVIARYGDYFNLQNDKKLSTYVIKMKHYKDRMLDICKHINYFLSYYDREHEIYTSIFSVKFMIDKNPNMSIKVFRDLILKRVVTPSVVAKFKQMSKDLYKIDINTDDEGKYKNTPKITNADAIQIAAVSFCIRGILPVCLHFANTNINFSAKRDYIDCFNKIFVKVIKLFEKDDIPIFNTLFKFVRYRADKYYSADIGICIKKKQLYGMTRSLYVEGLMNEVVIVKSLHKLDYSRSVVSFIDGVIFKFHRNFKNENFKSKPIELDDEDNSDDNDERMSHAEAIEMSIYRLDETNPLISDINRKEVLRTIDKNFNINISDDEFDFYYDNIKKSQITDFFLSTFYTRFFKDPYATENLNDEDSIRLLIYMKKYLQLKGLVIIPQICTARIEGKFKENIIKNQKFNELFEGLDIWDKIVKPKFKYIDEIFPNEDNPLKKKLSAFINSKLICVDYNENVNGLVYEDMNIAAIIEEFGLYLSLI